MREEKGKGIESARVGDRVGVLHGFDLGTSSLAFGRYVLKNLNLPVLSTNFASMGYTFVVFNSAGRE